jgi:NADP-dependent 3-hydroxy acid dehydrogenase YdfG
MVANNLVLIPGAAGVGRAVFEQLRAQDVPVRFMLRREDERAAEVKGSARRSSSGTSPGPTP